MRMRSAMGLLVGLAFGSSATEAIAAASSTVLVSRPSGLGPLPQPGNGESATDTSSISGDGRLVVFVSTADDLGAVDDKFHVYVRERVAGITTLVDRAPGGDAPGNGSSFEPAISRDGTTVCYSSDATNLVAGVSGRHIFVTKLATGQTTVADRATGFAGELGDAGPLHCSLDGTGARVVFDSLAENLVANDGNDATDVFMRDLTNETTTRVSVSSVGAEAPDGGREGVISADGLKVAFSTRSPLIPGDTGSIQDVYVRNLQTSALVRASVGTGGVQANAGSSSPSIDDTGTHVAFVSDANNITLGGDTNDRPDVFWRDLVSDTTLLVSRATGSGGALGDEQAFSPGISGNGLGVVFSSQATTLGAGAPPLFGVWVYLRRLGTNETTLLSRANGLAGAAADNVAFAPSVGVAPTVFAWTSDASNLTPDATGEFRQVFVRDLAGPTTELVSRPSGSSPRNSLVNDAFVPHPRSISADGRFVLFTSRADGLDPDGAGLSFQVFVRDTQEQTISLVSRGPGPTGVAGDATSFGGAISADGTHVAFFSRATNLLPGITSPQVYVRNLVTGDLVVASRADGVMGVLATYESSDTTPDISADGRRVSFDAIDPLVAGDANDSRDVYVRDIVDESTTLVSVNASGTAAAGDSLDASLSDDATVVAFRSTSADLPDANPPASHVYVHDRTAGTTVLADRRADDSPGTGHALRSMIGGDGARVVFWYTGDDLTGEGLSSQGALYVRDLGAGTTTLASREHGPSGAVAGLRGTIFSLSRDGRRVSFGAGVPAGPENSTQVFVRDLDAGTTILASAIDGTAATAGNANSFGSALDVRGDCIAFDSNASDLTNPSYPTRDFTQVYLRALTDACQATAPIPTTSTTLPPGAGGTPISAKTIVLRPGKVLKLVSTGASSLAPVDPTAGGGTLAVVGTTGSASYDLPASGWKTVGRKRPKGFKFKGGPCRVSLLRGRINATCKGSTGTLAVPEPGPLRIGLTLAAPPATVCVECGGKAVGKQTRAFKRKACRAPATCQ